MNTIMHFTPIEKHEASLLVGGTGTKVPPGLLKAPGQEPSRNPQIEATYAVFDPDTNEAILYGRLFKNGREQSWGQL